MVFRLFFAFSMPPNIPHFGILSKFCYYFVSEMADKLSYIRNFSNGEADIFLYDDIGFGVNASQFLNELKWAVEGAGARKINVRINSNGGLVTDGLGIFGAIMAYREKGIEINTWNDGIAASIAGVILMAGQKAYMVSHGLMMVHMAYSDGDQDEKTINALAAINSSLVKIFTERAGMQPEEMQAMLEKETWMNAEQAKELKLIDEIYKQPAMVNMTAVAEVFNKFKQSKMKQVTAYLNLAEDASENQVIEAIEAAKVNPEVEELKQKVAELEAEKAAKEAAELEMAAEAEVENAIKIGKFKAEEKSVLLDKAKLDLEGFKVLVNAVPTPHVSISAQIQNTADERANWTFRDWKSKDANGLNRLKDENPELFNKLISKVGR
jgi:ATP-dependent protease ClpP protease subunit